MASCWSEDVISSFRLSGNVIPELSGMTRSYTSDFPQKGITVIISSHILSEIQQTADYIGIIAKGTVGFEGKLQEQQDLEALFMKVVAKGGNES